MASVNKIILLGNCGRDPEVRYLPSGQAVANVSIATSSRRKDKQSGEVIEETQWHRVTFFDRLAEVVSEYVKKGKQIYVEGRVVYRKYTDKDGIERYSTDIMAHELQLLGGRDQDGGGRRDDHPDDRRPAAQGQRRQAPQGQGYREQSPGQRARAQQQGAQGNYGSTRGESRSSSGFDDMDDDIPF